MGIYKVSTQTSLTVSLLPRKRNRPTLWELGLELRKRDSLLLSENQTARLHPSCVHTSTHAGRVRIRHRNKRSPNHVKVTDCHKYGARGSSVGRAERGSFCRSPITMCRTGS